MQKTLDLDLTSAPDPVLFNADLVTSYGRMLEARCDEDCELDCRAVVPESARRTAYDRFRGAAAAGRADVRVAQNAYLCAECVEPRPRRTTVAAVERTDAEFWLGDAIKVRVCRAFFACALGLPDVRLDALLEPETFRWFRERGSAAAPKRDRDDALERPCTRFVLNSRKYLDRNSSAFVEETDSDVDVSLDDVLPSVYNNVINHIQSVPRVVNTWVNRENDRKFKFECSINLDEMYSNYVKKLKKNKKMANKKQYKKIYNMYVEKTFMRNDSMTL